MKSFRMFFVVMCGLLIGSFGLSLAQAQPVDVIVSPDEAEVDVGASLQFETYAFSMMGGSRMPVNIDAIEWSVEPDSMGKITADGFFVAGRHEGAVLIRAIIHIGSRRIVRLIAIRIGPKPNAFFRVKIVPENAVVPAGGEQKFRVVISRAGFQVPPKLVRWEIAPDSLGKIDSDGIFTAGNDVGRGKIVAHVEVDGLRLRAMTRLAVSPAATGAVSGYVTSDKDGAAIEGAVVKAVRLGRVHWVRKAETDANGDYLIGGLIPGIYVVRANARGHIMEFFNDTRNYLEATPLNIAVDDTASADFGLSEGGRIDGTVIADSDSMPLAGAHVAAVLVVNQRIARHAQTAADGTYEIDALPSGSYYVVADAAGYKSEFFDDAPNRSQAQFVDVVEPETKSGVDFGLATASAIQGVVTNEDDGAPIGGARILVYGMPNASVVAKRILRETRTNADGEYLLQIRPGKYIVQASARGFNSEFYDNKPDRSSADRVVVVADSHTTAIDFDLAPRSTISGTVTDQNSGLPIAGAVVEAFKERASVDPANASVNAGFRARTDSLGNYLIEDVPAGKYIVVAKAEEYLPEFYNEKSSKHDADILDVTTNGAFTDINFTLEDGGSISGIVATEKDSVPIPKALVRVFAANSDRHIRAYTDQDGAYKVSGLPTGSYYVQVVAEGFFAEFYDNARNRRHAKLVDVTAPDETPGIDVYLAKHRDRNGTIAGRVTSKRDETPLYGAVVVAVSPGKRVPHLTFTGPNGFYRVTDLPPGRYYVFAWHPGFAGEFYRNARRFKNADPVIVGSRPTIGIDFALSQSDKRGIYAIRGRIRVSGDNQPVEGILVNAITDNGVEVSAVTDANGDYVIEGLPAGNYSVEATGAGYSDASASAVAVGSGQDAQAVNLDMGIDNITDVGSDDATSVPRTFSLEQNYPNPFNPRTTIKYNLAESADVTLTIFNVLGQRVRTLVDKVQQAGSYAVQWDGQDNLGRQVASGVYILRIEAGTAFRMTKRMMLLK